MKWRVCYSAFTQAPNVINSLHHDPIVPIPTLPDETLDEPPKIMPLQDYVTTLGGIVSLPQDAFKHPRKSNTK